MTPNYRRKWRLTYYANLLRAVLLPESTGVKLDATLASAWFEDTDVGFRFVVEVSAGLVKHVSDHRVGLEGWLKGIRFLGGQVAAVLVRPSPTNGRLTTAVLDQFCDAVWPVPVCVGPSDHPNGQEDCEVVWYPSWQGPKRLETIWWCCRTRAIRQHFAGSSSGLLHKIWKVPRSL
ncbi:MAG: hypothetical protein CM1200mP20_11090 [Pseudomonadota bacterium]|nr:MAG: hypothetical protein CM1200mP20_11090 [Pseudomonadota bacterium]